jgi:hypothetical protein
VRIKHLLFSSKDPTDSDFKVEFARKCITWLLLFKLNEDKGEIL